MRNRWSDNDKNFGPFTYARDPNWRLAFVLRSGCDEYPGAYARVSIPGHTVLCTMPQWFIRPWRRRVEANWDVETIARLGRSWYEDVYPREYGFSYHDGFLQVFLGRQTMDSSTTQDWCCFLPWTQWRHVRLSFYELQGEHFWTEPQGFFRDWDATKQAEESCPAATFEFLDFDGELIEAKTIIEEREWRFGTGHFKWLSLFRKPKIKRSLRIDFSKEVGKRKGSWKGGMVGHSINLEPGELHESAFRRYCLENNLKFKEPLA